MSTYGHTSRRIDPESLRMHLEGHPGWVSNAEHTFSVGEQVLCAEGIGQVVRVLGKTQNGSRLLELKLADGRRDSYFAAASNVLIRSAELAAR